MYLKDIKCKKMYWIHLAQNTVQWRKIVSKVMNFFSVFQIDIK